MFTRQRGFRDTRRTGLYENPNTNLPLIITVKTDNAGTSSSNQFTAPVSTSDKYNITTSDGQQINGLLGPHTITFPTAGVYDISISGNYDKYGQDNAGDKLKVIELKQFGSKRFISGWQSFYGCANMVCSAIDTLFVPTYARRMFRGCVLFNPPNPNNWDLSGVDSLDEFCYGATNFNADVSGWDISTVIDLGNIFRGCPNFNSNISGWNISNVSDMFFGWNSLKNTYPYLDNIYNTWASLQVQLNVSVNFGSAKYTTAGEAARNTLINTYGWTIIDGGK